MPEGEETQFNGQRGMEKGIEKGGGEGGGNKLIGTKVRGWRAISRADPSIDGWEKESGVRDI